MSQANEIANAVVEQLKKKKDNAESSLKDKIGKLKDPAKQVSQDLMNLVNGEMTSGKFALSVIQNTLTGVAVFIPPPYGTAVSGITSLFFGFMKNDVKSNSLDKYEEKMRFLISDSAAKNYFDKTQQMLNEGMDISTRLFANFSHHNHTEKAYQLSIYRDIKQLLEICSRLQKKIFGTSEPRNYIYTFPLMQRFVLLYKYAIFYCDAFGIQEPYGAVESPESILTRKAQLYTEMFDVIAKVSRAIADDRQEHIKLQHNQKCAYHEIVLRDERNEKSPRVLPWKMSWQISPLGIMGSQFDAKPWKETDSVVEGTAKDTARVIAIMQCLRSTVLAVREFYKVDQIMFERAVLGAINEEIKAVEAIKSSGESLDFAKELTRQRISYEELLKNASNLKFTEKYEEVVKAEYEKLGKRYYVKLTRVYVGGAGSTKKSMDEASTPVIFELEQLEKSRMTGRERELFLDIEKEMILDWRYDRWQQKWANLDEPIKETEYHLRDEKGNVIQY